MEEARMPTQPTEAMSKQELPTLPPRPHQRSQAELQPWTVFVAACPGPGNSGTGALIVLDAGGLRIGREEEAGASGPCLVLADPSVSRRHAVLCVEPAGDELMLLDCNSSYGVYVNGSPITRATLHPGDILRLGDSVLVVGRGQPAPVEEVNALGIVGRAPAIHELRRTLRRVAPSGLVILAQGQTGTGKELVARAMHDTSKRSGAFVAINCAALPAPLVENLLFGHRRGAYTGATSDEDGAFVRARGGTLFLDEVGELPLESQPKLLRALENREVTPLGAVHPVAVDARIVVATNVDLRAAVAAGQFREDLYARLAGLVVRSPPLIERREDIVLLLGHFFAHAGLAERPMDADFVESVLRYSWPRNIRELVKLCERLVVLHPHAARWERAMLDVEMQGASAPAITPRRAEGTGPIGEGPPSRDQLIALLAQCDGNVTEVARLVGRNRKQVYRWMTSYALEPGTGRGQGGAPGSGA
jgi:DNA-binding NtrC family response regulator